MKKKIINHDLHIVMSMFHKDKPTTYFIMDCCCQPNCGNLKKIPTQQTYGPFCFVRSLARKHPFCTWKYFGSHAKKNPTSKLFYACTVFLFVSVVHISKYKLCNHSVQCTSGEIRGQLVVKSWIESCDHPKKLSQEKNKKSWPPNIYNAWSHWCRDCEKSYVIDKFISFIGRRIKVLGKHQLFLWCDIIQDWIEVKLDMQSYVLDSSFLG